MDFFGEGPRPDSVLWSEDAADAGWGRKEWARRAREKSMVALGLRPALRAGGARFFRRPCALPRGAA